MNKVVNSNGKAKLEFIARITMQDGTVIERKVEADGGIPDPKDIDVYTLDGFLDGFDEYERPAVKARNKIGEEITQGFLDELKKTGKKK